jgi:hypothetical protein
MRVPATLGATWYVIEVVNPLNVEGYMVTTLNECKVATWILDFG